MRPIHGAEDHASKAQTILHAWVPNLHANEPYYSDITQTWATSRVETLGGSDPVMSNSHSALAKCHDGKDGWSLGRLVGSVLLRTDTAPVSALTALPKWQWKGLDIREGLIGFRISSLREALFNPQLGVQTEVPQLCISGEDVPSNPTLHKYLSNITVSLQIIIALKPDSGPPQRSNSTQACVAIIDGQAQGFASNSFADRGEVSPLFEVSSSVLSRRFNSNPTLSSRICDKRQVFLVVPHVP
ncbi:hypothetical protein QQF64_017818 [Cirrhinus molitorella]|uniref:Uncharacterized protein n=1 Tax=Cirrhinus molitorella TaxID=172907 RepID=A0ABR3LL51_9TELE